MPAHFSEKKFGIAENTGQRIVQFVAENFAEIFIFVKVRARWGGFGIRQFLGEAASGAETPFDASGGIGVMGIAGSHKVGSARSNQRGEPCRKGLVS